MNTRITARIMVAIFTIGLLFTLALALSGCGVQTPPANATHTSGKTVYVCSCLGTKSCPCMTEANMEGPCACGTNGGPPMKAVPQNSAWAKGNREALAK
jgi:hypothetical protein